MHKRLTFQEMIWRLSQFWAGQGCILWQPHNVQVGAGTMNPATFLRVLGPEPWRVGYVEPSIRPDDSRYGQNPNRLQQHFQYQVILKPDPGNPQELYLESLEALGLDLRRHDVRFVEDNWETPALGAWGLGWEVWLDGQEITQFTYFQQAGGITLDPVSVEITYGLERLLMPIQGVGSFPELEFREGLSYGTLLLPSEEEYSRYNLDEADIGLLREQFTIYERETQSCLERKLVLPAYDYLLKCSHAFNLLDARGAIGVAERAGYFARMRALAAAVSQGYLAQRERLGYPLMKAWPGPMPAAPWPSVAGRGEIPETPQDFVLEIGTEELPAGDLHSALEELRELAPKALSEARLGYGTLQVLGTPRRLALYIEGLAARQKDQETVRRGPPADLAYDAEGKPSRAAEGFARSAGVPVQELEVQELDGRRYAVARLVKRGLPTPEVLAGLLPPLIGGLRFPLSMRWNAVGVSFSRPIRWLVALWGGDIVPFEYAGVHSGKASRGSRPRGSPHITIGRAQDYLREMQNAGIVLDPVQRRELIAQEVARLAEGIEGRAEYAPEFLAEVANLVEEPQAIRGSFAEEFLSLPAPVLATVMQKHQRYFPVFQDGRLLPHFIAIANGKRAETSVIRQGNEAVLRARLADARFFFQADTSQPLEAFVPRLATLTFHEKLGSMLDKTRRLEALIPLIILDRGISPLLAEFIESHDMARRAARLCKADLATQMVKELTSLQGVMGREYALRSGETPGVAEAIYGHYLPRFADDGLPTDKLSIILGIADRLDTLVGLFAIGLVPTGSADPYGLRRQALGLVRILTSGGIGPFNLQEAIRRAAQGLPVGMSQEAEEALWEFLVERLRGEMRVGGFRYDLVEAVLAELPELGNDCSLAFHIVRELQGWVNANPEKFQALLPAFARTVRILRYTRERGLAPKADEYPLNPEALAEPAATSLYEAYLKAYKEVEKARKEQDAPQFMEALYQLAEPINFFFDQVLVVTQDAERLFEPKEEARRHNLLALLERIAELAGGWLDFSKLEGF